MRSCSERSAPRSPSRGPREGPSAEAPIRLRPLHQPAAGQLYPGVPTPIAGLTPDRCDLFVIRENTEGLYVGAGGIARRGTPQEIATQESINTRFGAERAFGLPSSRPLIDADV